MWVVYGYAKPLGYIHADTLHEALTKARALWGNLAVVYAERWRGVL